MNKHQLDATSLSIYFTQFCSLHVSGEISPIIRSYKTVQFRYGIIVHKYVRRYDVVEYVRRLTRQYTARAVVVYQR